LTEAAATQTNVVPLIKAAVLAHATVGEICDALRSVWGTYKPAEFF
jgi:methylmalonyl-CoA mutase N-terminal domain/subunit